MTNRQKRSIKGFLKRLLVLLIVYCLFMYGIYALINQYLPNGADSPWWVVLYISVSVLLYASLVFVVEYTRKKRN